MANDAHYGGQIYLQTDQLTIHIKCCNGPSKDTKSCFRQAGSSTYHTHFGVNPESGRFPIQFFNPIGLLGRSVFDQQANVKGNHKKEMVKQKAVMDGFR